MQQTDQDKLRSFLGRVVGDLGAVGTGPLVVLGDRLGLFKAMQAGDKVTAASLPPRTSTWGGNDNNFHEGRRRLLLLGTCFFLAEGFPLGVARAVDDFAGRSTKENFMTGLNTLLASLGSGKHLFADTLAFVAAHYDYKPQAFRNGELENAAGENEGSCKTLGMAKLEGLSDRQALLAFGEHYRSVLAKPEGSAHGNIRNLMAHGLAGVTFAAQPLTRKR